MVLIIVIKDAILRNYLEAFRGMLQQLMGIPFNLVATWN